ncbi:MAG: DUF697 domain-containing protein, partial [Bacteroidota bacterium]
KSTKEEIPQDVLAQETIRDHVLYAMACGAIPGPFIDLAAVTAVQIDMLQKLANIHGLDYSEASSRALIGALAGNMLTKVGSSLFKIIPGIGTLIGMASQVVISGASTYALGDVFHRHASEGGTFENMNMEVLKKYYEQKYEEGKQKAADWKEEVENEIEEVQIEIKNATEGSPKDDQSIALQKLKELGELKEKGVISAREFTAMKKQIKEEFKEAGESKAAPKKASPKKPAAKKPVARKKPAPKKKTDTDKKEE